MCIFLSTELNIWSSSWGIMNLDASVNLIFSSVVRLIISKRQWALTSILRIICWQFAIQLLLFFLTFLFKSFLLLFILFFILPSQNNTALVVIFSNWIKKKRTWLLSVGIFTPSQRETWLSSGTMVNFNTGLLGLPNVILCTFAHSKIYLIMKFIWIWFLKLIIFKIRNTLQFS